MAETAIPKMGLGAAGAPTDADVLAPTPGALLRRRVLRHWGLMIGATILGVVC